VGLVVDPQQKQVLVIPAPRPRRDAAPPPPRVRRARPAADPPPLPCRASHAAPPVFVRRFL
jgi:hypothetical protein